MMEYSYDLIPYPLSQNSPMDWSLFCPKEGTVWYKDSSCAHICNCVPTCTLLALCHKIEDQYIKNRCVFALIVGFLKML